MLESSGCSHSKLLAAFSFWKLAIRFSWEIPLTSITERSKRFISDHPSKSSEARVFLGFHEPEPNLGLNVFFLEDMKSSSRTPSTNVGS